MSASGRFSQASRLQRNGQSHPAQVRVVHNVAQGPKVDVYLDDKQVLSDVPYKAVSDYLKVPAGKHHVDVTAAGDRTALFEADVDLKSGQRYTVIAHGLASKPESLALLPLVDNQACPAHRKAHVRFIHAAAGAPPVDVYVGDGPTRIFERVSYGETGNPAYLPVAAKAYDLGVTPAGSMDLVVGPVTVDLENGGIYTVIASGKLNDRQTPLTAIIVDDSHRGCVQMM